MNVLSTDKQIMIINTVVNSLVELVKILKITTKLSDEIHFTITEVLIFLQKVIKNLPEILITSTQVNYKREEIVGRFHIVLAAWNDYLIEPEIFYEAFEEFSTLWFEYEEVLKMVENNSTTIYLSLN